MKPHDFNIADCYVLLFLALEITASSKGAGDAEISNEIYAATGRKEKSNFSDYITV